MAMYINGVLATPEQEAAMKKTIAQGSTTTYLPGTTTYLPNQIYVNGVLQTGEAATAAQKTAQNLIQLSKEQAAIPVVDSQPGAQVYIKGVLQTGAAKEAVLATTRQAMPQLSAAEVAEQFQKGIDAQIAANSAALKIQREAIEAQHLEEYKANAAANEKALAAQIAAQNAARSIPIQVVNPNPTNFFGEVSMVAKAAVKAVEQAAIQVAAGKAPVSPDIVKFLAPVTAVKEAVVGGVSSTINWLGQTKPGIFVTETSKAIGKGIEQGISEAKASESPIIKTTGGIIAGTVGPTGIIAGTVGLGVGLVTHPVQTSAGLTAGIIQAPGKAITALKTEPYGAVGFGLGTLVGGIGISKATTAVADVAKVSIAKTLAKEVPAENIFAKTVLTGEERMPLTSGTAESLKLFEATKGISPTITKSIIKIPEEESLFGVHATSAFPAKAELPISAGAKGAVGLEDPGLYITPLGKGSPYFLGIEPGAAGTSISLSPFPKAAVKPQVVEIAFKEIKTLPKEVLKQPGFAPVIEYFKTIKPEEGAAYITKRSMIGQGEVPRQKFVAPADFTAPISGKLTVERGGVIMKVTEVKKGDILSTAGTSELEAVIPAGTPIVKIAPTTLGGKILGYEYFTTYKGKVVPIREYAVKSLTEDITKGLKTGEKMPTVGEVAKTVKEIRKYGAETSEYFGKPAKIYPLSYGKLAAVSYAAPKAISIIPSVSVSPAFSIIPSITPSVLTFQTSQTYVSEPTTISTISTSITKTSKDIFSISKPSVSKAVSKPEEYPFLEPSYPKPTVSEPSSFFEVSPKVSPSAYISPSISPSVSISPIVSTAPSYKPSVAISEIVSYKPTEPSYKPSYKPSDTSYKPSYKPSEISYRTSGRSYGPSGTSYPPYYPTGRESSKKKIIQKSKQSSPFIFKSKSKKKQSFITEVRRHGKFVPIGTSEFLPSAISAGAARVRTTLAASFRVREAGTNKFIPLPTGREFRPAKRNPFIAVQARGKRLSSPFEVKEIQASKKKKKIKFI